jgi:hypothetical protein
MSVPLLKVVRPGILEGVLDAEGWKNAAAAPREEDGRHAFNTSVGAAQSPV